jgi:hypothetical protein
MTDLQDGQESLWCGMKKPDSRPIGMVYNIPSVNPELSRE